MRTYDGNLGLINANTSKKLILWLEKYKIIYDEIYFGKPWPGEGGFYVDDRTIRPSEFIKLSYKEINKLLDSVNRLVIVPSAKTMKELEIEIGDIPSGMIPIGGKPAIAYISDFYLSNGFKISVAVDHDKEEIIDYVSKSNLLIETIDVKNSSSLGETLLKSIKITDFSTNLLVINFAILFLLLKFLILTLFIIQTLKNNIDGLLLNYLKQKR